MLIHEAEVLERLVHQLPPEAFPLLHLGSSTEAYRTVDQPHVGLIFARLDGESQVVVHADLKAAPGVDLVGDFTTDEGLTTLQRAGCVSVLCANLLEHLEMDPWLALDRVLSLVQPGGFAVVSGPTVFGHHADPIDNGFRPSAEDIADALPAPFAIEHVEATRERRLAWYYAGMGQNYWGFTKSLVKPSDRRTWISRVTSAGRRAEAFIVVARRGSHDD
jgi:hypothetical protein